MKTSLEHKTIRPGSLSDYSFYYSNRLPAKVEPAQKHAHAPRLPIVKLLLLVAVLCAGYFGFKHYHVTSQLTPPRPPIATAGHSTAANPCLGNTFPQFIKVSVSKRHLWACNGTHRAYDTPVITGMTQYAATVTPSGTYKIYAKQQNTVLTGSDESGNWRDPVSYWMPFLNNQYGTYGFHDATWRDPSQFGTVSPSSAQASHDCVELPLGAAQWLYAWSTTGTTVSIQS